jgi:hypothetical protein
MQQQLLHLQAGLGIERTERLVHQEELGLHQQAARDTDALLHAAGELVGIVVLEAVETDQVDRALRLLLEAAALVALCRAARCLRTVSRKSADSWNTPARFQIAAGAAVDPAPSLASVARSPPDVSGGPRRSPVAQERHESRVAHREIDISERRQSTAPA